MTNQPRTPEGKEAWHVYQIGQNQVRRAGMEGVVVGLDMSAMVTIAGHLGYGGAGSQGGILLEMLGAIEQGVLIAQGGGEMIGEKEEESDGAE